MPKIMLNGKNYSNGGTIIDDNSTSSDRAWSGNKLTNALAGKVDKTGDPIVFKTDNIPEEAANLSATATTHRITAYQNGLSIPYKGDNTNDGGILRVRGKSESDCILELGTWDDSGAGETIQFNYYPTTSQVTPTYSVSVPKKSGTIALTSDIPDISGKVNKSGDTMTGALTMNNVNANVKDTDVKVGTAPSGTIYGNGYYCQSNNGGDLFYVRATQDTSDNVGMQIEVRRAIGSTTYYNTVRLGISNNGTKTVNISDASAWRSAIGCGSIATYGGLSSVGFTRSHASVSYQEGLVCNRFGNVVTFAGYFSCGATIGANTTLYSGLPKPAGGKHIYFTWSGSDFYLHGSDGTIRTNGQITPKTYIGTFTYVCA